LALTIIFGAIFCSAAKINNNNDVTSFYNDYFVYKILDGRPLFDENGKKDIFVANELASVIAAMSANSHNKTEWSNGKPYVVNQLGATEAYYETNANDFSNFALSQKGSSTATHGAVLIKLFPDVENKTRVVGALGSDGSGGAVTEFTSNSWYQLVYRSLAGDSGASSKDVLTLYAVNPYRTSSFNQDSNGTLTDDFGNAQKPTSAQATSIGLSWNQTADYNYQYEGNYSTSIVRTNLARDWTAVNRHFASQPNGQSVDDYFVTPNNLPGKWQSSAFQTGTNKLGFYQYGNGIGASLYKDTYNDFSINNGMDGQSAGFANTNGWAKSKIQTNYADKIFLPSSFETSHMGFNKDSANGEGCLADYTSPATGFYNTSDRTGLWQLNAFDRAISSEVSNISWMRSGISTDSFQARASSYNGNGTYGYSQGTYGVRPALHLDLSNFKSFPMRTLRFMLNGGVFGSTVDRDSVTVGVQLGMELDWPLRTATEEVSKEGCTFLGWFLDPELTIPIDPKSRMPFAELKVYAKWSGGGNNGGGGGDNGGGGGDNGGGNNGGNNGGGDNNGGNNGGNNNGGGDNGGGNNGGNNGGDNGGNNGGNNGGGDNGGGNNGGNNGGGNNGGGDNGGGGNNGGGGDNGGGNNNGGNNNGGGGDNGGGGGNNNGGGGDNNGGNNGGGNNGGGDNGGGGNNNGGGDNTGGGGDNNGGNNNGGGDNNGGNNNNNGNNNGDNNQNSNDDDDNSSQNRNPYWWLWIAIATSCGVLTMSGGTVVTKHEIKKHKINVKKKEYEEEISNAKSEIQEAITIKKIDHAKALQKAQEASQNIEKATKTRQEIKDIEKKK